MQPSRTPIEGTNGLLYMIESSAFCEADNIWVLRRLVLRHVHEL